MNTRLRLLASIAALTIGLTTLILALQLLHTTIG